MGWLTQLLKGKKVAGKALKKYTPTKHEKFMMKDPYERAAIISRRESAKRGDVYTGTSVVGTPSPHRSAKAIKKYSGPRSYQLTDPKRRGPHAKGGRIGFAIGDKVLGMPPKKVGSIARLTGDTGGVKEVFPGMGIQGGASRGIKKGTKIRNYYAGLKRAHHTKQKILKAKAGRAQRAKQEAGAARLEAQHPGFKGRAAKTKFARQFRKAGIK